MVNSLIVISQNYYPRIVLVEKRIRYILLLEICVAYLWFKHVLQKDIRIALIWIVFKDLRIKILFGTLRLLNEGWQKLLSIFNQFDWVSLNK